MTFLKKERIYRSGNTIDKSFYNVLPKDLTITTENLTKLPDLGTLGQKKKLLIPLVTSENKKLITPFKEVTIVPSIISKEVADLQSYLNSMLRNKTGNWHEYLFNTIKQVIKKRWDINKFHLIGASSGYDSRVIIMAIKELHKELGDSWLGETLFVENHGEGKEFTELMRIAGWDKKYYHVYREGVEPGMLHEFSFGMKEYYCKFNGLGTFPVNQWYDPYIVLHEEGYIPIESQVQFFTGYGANEIDERALKLWNSVEKYIQWHYTLQLSHFNFYGEGTQIFWDFDYIKELFKYSHIKLSNERATQMISKKLFPQFDKVFVHTTETMQKTGYKYINTTLMTDIHKRYMRTWYGKNIKCKPNNHVSYNEWWMHYCMASITEHLLEKGYNIRIV